MERARGGEQDGICYRLVVLRSLPATQLAGQPRVCICNGQCRSEISYYQSLVQHHNPFFPLRGCVAPRMDWNANVLLAALNRLTTATRTWSSMHEILQDPFHITL
jgi:hypothetical protein